MLLSHNICFFFFFHFFCQDHPIAANTLMLFLFWMQLAGNSSVAFGLDLSVHGWKTPTSMASALWYFDLAGLGDQGCSWGFWVLFGQREPSCQALVINKTSRDKRDDVMILLTPWRCQTWGRSHQCRHPGRLLVFPASGWNPRGCQQ